MEVEDENNFKVIRCIFSPCGSKSSIILISYVMYECASRVTTFGFSVFSPLLIDDLGDKQFGAGNGKITWGYVVAAYTITTVLTYLTLASAIEFENNKCNTLLYCSYICAFLYVLFIFCFSSQGVYLAIILIIFTKTLQRTADVAFESMLDEVSKREDNVYQVSLRANVTGYIGMIGFVIFAIIVVGIVYMSLHPDSLWTESIIPLICIGIWYLFFLLNVSRMLPTERFKGPPLPDDIDRRYHCIDFVVLAFSYSPRYGI